MFPHVHSLDIEATYPSPLLIATGESIPLLCVEGVPGLPGAPQDDAGLTRKFEMSHVRQREQKSKSPRVGVA